MKFTSLLPIVALTTAFVIPDEQVMSQVAIENHERPSSIWDTAPCTKHPIKDLKDTFTNTIQASKNAFDRAFDHASEAGDKLAQKLDGAAIHTKSWLESAPATFDITESRI